MFSRPPLFALVGLYVRAEVFRTTPARISRKFPWHMVKGLVSKTRTFIQNKPTPQPSFGNTRQENRMADGEEWEEKPESGEQPTMQTPADAKKTWEDASKCATKPAMPHKDKHSGEKARVYLHRRHQARSLCNSHGYQMLQE